VTFLFTDFTFSWFAPIQREHRHSTQTFTSYGSNDVPLLRVCLLGSQQLPWILGVRTSQPSKTVKMVVWLLV